MKKNKLQWFSLQQKKRQQSIAWRKDKGIKKSELEQRLIKKEEVYPCELELGSFLRKNEEVDIEFKEDLIEDYGNESHLRKLRMISSKGNLESHSFKTNILCVNVGYIDEGNLSNPVTKKEKRKILTFQEMKGDLQNLMMKEEEKLLNVVVKDFAGNGQSLKADAKEEHKLNGNIEYFVEDGQSLWNVNLEDNQDQESLLIVDAKE
jgi:hypothetical protein